LFWSNFENHALLMRKISSLLLCLCLSLPLWSQDGRLDDAWYRRYLGQKLVSFANLFEGIPYDYANTDPLRGFDCSGFVQFVYGNFNVKVPRSSAQFAQYGQTVPLQEAIPGDILLFKGSNVRDDTPGHLGIISEISGTDIKFLHSATSNRRGIMQSSLSESYFKDRFIKVIRVL
jgi:murein DD-endopeptidase / murein LD-carboxypeptidase